VKSNFLNLMLLPRDGDYGPGISGHKTKERAEAKGFAKSIGKARVRVAFKLDFDTSTFRDLAFFARSAGNLP
jgi:hypothetical protein